MGRSEEITQFLARLESLIREGNWEGAFNLEELSPIMEGLEHPDPLRRIAVKRWW